MLYKRKHENPSTMQVIATKRVPQKGYFHETNERLDSLKYSCSPSKNSVMIEWSCSPSDHSNFLLSTNYLASSKIGLSLFLFFIFIRRKKNCFLVENLERTISGYII